jgi:tetratricopeptide (TPR) repeat protein
MKPYRTITIPLEAQYLYQRGMMMVSLQRTDAAVNCFQQAVFIAPGFSKAYRELGNCLALLGRPEEASLYRVKASRTDPILCNDAVENVP